MPPSQNKESKDDVILYMLETHTSAINELSKSLTQFTISQQVHDNAIKTLSSSIEKLIGEISTLKNETNKLQPLVEDVDKIKKTNKIAIAIYTFAIFAGPTLISIILKKIFNIL